MSQDRTFIILGASGFLGRNLLRSLGKKAVGVSRAEFEAGTWKKAGGACVVNCIGISDLALCEKDPALARRVNTELPIETGRWCKDNGVPFIQIGSDGVFPNDAPGAAPRYRDIDARPAPVTAYGRSKVAAEEGLRALGWGQCLRLSFVGGGLGTTRGLITFLAGQLASAEGVVSGFTDVWFSPIHLDDMAVSLMSAPLEGFAIRHWGSYPALTKYEFLERAAKAAGYAPKMKAVRRAELPGAHQVPLDQSLKCLSPFPMEETIAKSARSLREEAS